MNSPFDVLRTVDHDAALDAYAEKWQRLQVPAHTVLLREGETARRLYFIEKGCLRLWFYHKRKDITFQFFFENQLVSSPESFHREVPSIFGIESLEQCHLFALSRDDYKEMRSSFQEKSPRVLSTIVEIMFDHQLHYMNHLMSFVRDTPAERYRKLLELQPGLIQRVPQRYIASYLGITAVSLSRIRSRSA